MRKVTLDWRALNSFCFIKSLQMSLDSCIEFLLLSLFVHYEVCFIPLIKIVFCYGTIGVLVFRADVLFEVFLAVKLCRKCSFLETIIITGMD